jgi:hypothetical protein
MRTAVFAMAALVMAAPAAFAQPQTGSGGAVATGSNGLPQSTGAAGTTADGQRRICRRIEVESSSRMSIRRVCMTAREWKAYERDR